MAKRSERSETSARSLRQPLHTPSAWIHQHAAQWVTHWSDQFLFGYFVAGKNGWVQTLDGASKGADDKIPHQQSAAQFGKPSNWSIVVDAPLLERLFTCWRRCYLHERDRGKLRRLFRSLEVAFHACLFPADGLTSMNDIGTRLALWVSAFEVLCHPGGSVNKRHVQKVLSDAPYSLKTLTVKRYMVSYQGNKLRATLPEALYDDLYWARNQFLHGMPVRPTMLRYRQSKELRPSRQHRPGAVQCGAGCFPQYDRYPGRTDGFQEAHLEKRRQVHAHPRGHRTRSEGPCSRGRTHLRKGMT